MAYNLLVFMFDSAFLFLCNSIINQVYAMRNSRNKYLPVLLEISLVAVIFITLNVFFQIHFYPGTSINGVNVSFLTVEEADKRLARLASTYTLVLKERGNVREQVLGSDLGLKLNTSSVAFKGEQNKTLWFISCFRGSSVHMDGAFLYDENLLEARINKLDCLDDARVVEPMNASLIYENGCYKSVKEVYGNKVIKPLLFFEIKRAVSNGISELDLEKHQCYENPKIRLDSKKIRNTRAVAEGYLASKIIYLYPGGSEVVDKNEISSWVEFDSDLTITFNTKKIKDYLRNTLASHYDTYGMTRDFLTSSGKWIKVGGGDYGWKIDIAGEAEDLIQDIVTGRTISKEPKYSQKGAEYGINDIGQTFVEIDLTRQHLWFYKNGLLITQGNVVTGNVKKGFKTPEGIYSLKYRLRDAELRGENYQTKVSYWMPFNNDIGIHDALWRSSFGGNIYLTRGSHGCVNAPYQLAETLFKNITVGTPIVCYY